MNAIAKELNQTLEGSVVLDFLSETGKKFYMPKGIVTQSAEASKSATRYNATIGMANRAGQPIHFSVIRDLVPGLEVDEIFPYAPNPGVLRLRELWKIEMLKKNPDLEGKEITLPIVTTGITNGLSIIAELFTKPGDKILVTDMYWENYNLIFSGIRNAEVVFFPFYAADRFNLAGFRKGIEENICNGKITVILNFPNNPTGYTPSHTEALKIVEILKETAEAGTKVLVLFDDSYFNLFYEEETCKQSLFAYCADLHPNLLAVKLDGATKEEFVWGFRIGFITYAAKGLTAAQLHALTQKTLGMIRATVSNCNSLGQNLLIHAMESNSYAAEKEEAFRFLNNKYKKVKEVLKGLSSTAIETLPYNSGYFMCFKLIGIDAEVVRKYLLSERGIGTISIHRRYLRIAYACIDVDQMEDLYKEIFAAVEKLKQK